MFGIWGLGWDCCTFDGLALEGLVELWGLVTGPDTLHTLRITFLSRRRSDVQHSSYCPPSNLSTGWGTLDLQTPDL